MPLERSEAVNRSDNLTLEVQRLWLRGTRAMFRLRLNPASVDLLQSKRQLLATKWQPYQTFILETKSEIVDQLQAAGELSQCVYQLSETASGEVLTQNNGEDASSAEDMPMWSALDDQIIEEGLDLLWI